MPLHMKLELYLQKDVQYEENENHPPPVPPSEWKQLVDNAPYVGEFKELSDLETELDGLVQYTISNPENNVVSNHHFVLGFESTGMQDVSVSLGGHVEIIRAHEITMHGALTPNGLYYVAFQVPINRISTNVHGLHLTNAVNVRCARFMDHISQGQYYWQDLNCAIPLYKKHYRIWDNMAAPIPGETWDE